MREKRYNGHMISNYSYTGLLLLCTKCLLYIYLQHSDRSNFYLESSTVYVGLFFGPYFFLSSFLFSLYKNIRCGSKCIVFYMVIGLSLFGFIYELFSSNILSCMAFPITFCNVISMACMYTRLTGRACNYRGYHDCVGLL
uniref:Uncharacterized protein n=1 Tax=Oryza barthii TaxID=65489 RepID=A0A0D3H6K0_9ORYZ